MNKKSLFVGLCFISIFCAFLVIANIDNDHDLKSYYGKCIDKRINCCDKKALLWDSKFRNINCCAVMSMIKATYFRENKHRLIKEMYKSNIGKEQYKVDHFLNENFFKVFKSSTIINYLIVESDEDYTIL